MKHFLQTLFVTFSRRRRPPCAARQRPPVRLSVESMEDRLVATVGVVSTSPFSAGAMLPGANAQVAPGTPSDPILPETPVHGYKWRRRPWWPNSVPTEASTPTVMAVDPSVFTNLGSGPTRPAA
jgi:hypothetical protein